MTFITPANFRQLPPVWEVSQPFQVNGAGGVSYDADPVQWAINHILALLLTTPGERVMRPSYGAGLRAFVWENNDPFVEAQMIATIQNAMAGYEPNIMLKNISIVPNSGLYGVFNISISFSVGTAPTVHTVAFTLGGVGIEVST